MRLLFLLLLISSFYSCEKIDDDFNNICNSNCTVIEGTFTTANNIPIKNVKVELDYRASTGTFGVSVRNIRQTTTDDNGYYRMEFFIEDNELGVNADGYFRLQSDYSNVANTDNYIIPNNALIGLDTWDVIYSINSRDTIINKSVYVPTKAILKINLLNYFPIEENDFFSVVGSYPGGGFSFSANGQPNQLFEMNVAQNEITSIEVKKRKNSIISIVDEVDLFIPENDILEINYEY
jgi:hypothetical protein